MSNTTIRPYTPEDKLACLEAFKSNVPRAFTESEIADYEHFFDLYAEMDKGENATTLYFVLEYEGRVVACGGFGDRYRNGIITLTWGLVHQAYHKRGLGAMLLEFRLGEIRKRFLGKTVYIDTTQHSAPFFAKYGFVTTKVTDDFYAEGLHRYDMELQY